MTDSHLEHTHGKHLLKNGLLALRRGFINVTHEASEITTDLAVWLKRFKKQNKTVNYIAGDYKSRYKTISSRN